MTRTCKQTAVSLLSLTILIAITTVARGTELKSESFDHDPNWEAFNNHIAAEKNKTVIQDFGYTNTTYAGKAPGEMGGTVTRAAEPAYYAANIGHKTLNDKLTASGTLALTKTTGGAGLFFGFFRADQPGSGGRPVSSFGFDIDCEKHGARVAVRLISGKNQSCGTFVTPFIPGKFRPTPIRNDGTRYHWKLDYDPEAANGDGRFTVTFTSDAHKPGELEKPNMPQNYKDEARRRFPSTTQFSVDLPPGFKQQNTTFDHFGLMNAMKAGGTANIYFDDLEYNGHLEDFTQDPHWDASGNRLTYLTGQTGGAHDFGYGKTSFAGGQPGEIGGIIWRAGKYAYYADRVGPLSLTNHLEARGKVVLKVGAPDSDMFIGWFNSADKAHSPVEAGNFLGIHVGGPTRVGHYFQPSITSATGTKNQSKTGPVLEPGKTYDWSLDYDPTAENGRGAITVKLGDQSTTLVLRKNIKSETATFDRFGLFSSTIGGQVVKIYFDDLQYTAH